MGMLLGTRRSLFGGRKATATYIDKVLTFGPTAYWPLNETAGGVANDFSGNGYDGAYTGVTLNNAPGPDGGPTPLFDGTNDFVNISTAGLIAAFDGDEGTLMIWHKVFDLGVWTDGTMRMAINLRADNDNQIFSRKQAANNTWTMTYEANNVIETESTAALSTLVWTQTAITWSISAGVDGEAKFFRDGAQAGGTDITLGAWAGALAANSTLLGAAFSGGPSNPWHGWLAQAAIWAGTVMTPAQIADLYVMP